MKMLNTVDNKHDARLAHMIGGVIDALPALIMLLVAVLLMLSATGCMSARDGRTHTLFTGLQYDNALAQAESRGAVRVMTQAGAVRWIGGEQAETYRARRAKAYKDGSELPVVDAFAGQTADEIRTETYSPWKRFLAWLGDCLTWSGITSGAIYGGARLVDAMDGGDGSDRQDSTRVDITGDGNSVQIQGGSGNVNTSQRDRVSTETP